MNSINFKERSQEPELIDFPEQLSWSETEATFRALRQVNNWLGGRSTCLRQLKPIISRLAKEREGQPIRLLDLGSGGSDIPAFLIRWARGKGYSLQIVAVDFSLSACRWAVRELGDRSPLHILCADAFRLPIQQGWPDLIVCSAFLHHFSNKEIAALLQELQTIAGTAVIVNDLQRSRLAYAGIRVLTRLLSGSAVVRNDGPLSVLRGFQRSDWDEIFSHAQIRERTIAWRWAFRWAVTIPATGRP